MNLADGKYDNVQGYIFARAGNTIHRLALRIPNGNGKPVLVDTAGAAFHPWEVELLHWPPEAETDLQRSGYLPVRPTDMELWCNCAD